MRLASATMLVGCLPLVPLWAESITSQPGDTNHDEAKVPEYTLPPLLPASVTPTEALDVWYGPWRQFSPLLRDVT